MPGAKDPTKDLKEAAAALPNVIEGTSCSQTSYKANKKAIPTYTVAGVEKVTTPAGTFPVTFIEAGNSAEYLFKHAGEYKFNEDLGPIELPGGYLLVNIEGGMEVDTGLQVNPTQGWE